MRNRFQVFTIAVLVGSLLSVKAPAQESTVTLDKEPNRAEVIRLLVKAGARVNARDQDGETALHGALDEDVVKALIQAGADVNARNKDGETPLMTNVSEDVLKILVAAGANIHARDNRGRSVLDNVLRYDHSSPRVEYLRSLKIEETKKN